jgi:formiminotetrahydrofolate cyclodeaminase
VPLQVAAQATDLLDLAREVTEVGNVNAVSDGAAGAQVLAAAANAALANVEINAASMKDPKAVERLRGQASALRERARTLVEATEAAFRSRT